MTLDLLIALEILKFQNSQEQEARFHYVDLDKSKDFRMVPFFVPFISCSIDQSLHAIHIHYCSALDFDINGMMLTF